MVRHDLRHVAACWMLFDIGLDPAVVANKLGHADPNFTIRRYIGIRGNPDTTAMPITDLNRPGFRRGCGY